jgi:hypothetical protein
MAEKHLPNTSALMRMADRLRAESEALLVLVIRVDDVAFSVDPEVSPRDAANTIQSEMPGFIAHLEESRKKKIR